MNVCCDVLVIYEKLLSFLQNLSEQIKNTVTVSRVHISEKISLPAVVRYTVVMIAYEFSG